MQKNIIGNTPLVKIVVEYNGIIKNIFAKLEYFNFTGSIKDRIAKKIIDEAYKNGSLKKGMPIVEASSGNTGISFAALGALYGHKVHIFIPSSASVERVKILKMYGATVHLIRKGNFELIIKKADNFARKINGFTPNQFSNELNALAHYETTGQEIVDKIKHISAFVCGFGTGGTIMGVGKKIKETFKNARVIALEPENMTLLSDNKKTEKHIIEGIGDDFVPILIDKSLIDKNVVINDLDAANMCKILAKQLGLGVGISSGANFLASAIYGGKNTVTIFADDFKKYLSTPLFSNINDAGFISNKIKILRMEIV